MDSQEHNTVSSYGSYLPSSHHSSSSHFTRRVCASSGCREVLGSAHNDPHTVCIVCRDGFCDVNNRCHECAEWSSKLVLSALKYQQRLQKRRECKAKRKSSLSSGNVRAGTNPTPFPILRDASQSPAPSGLDSGFVHGSVGPDDSVSQIPSSSKDSPWDMSTFFKWFASFLGLSEGSQQGYLPAMLSALVAKEIESRLAANTASFPATFLPSAQGAVQSTTNPLSGLDARQSMQLFLADVPVGGNQGQERSGGDLGLAQAPSSLAPSMGKCSRPPKDVPWRIKRSCPGGGETWLHHVKALQDVIRAGTGVYLQTNIPAHRPWVRARL